MNVAFRRCLEDADVIGARKLWMHMAPHLPQPASDAEALATIHMARTSSEAMALNLRAYSHRWLLDRGLPSSLPDHLKPKAERMYPVVVEGVGIAVIGASSLTKPIVKHVRQAMGDAVAECYAEGDTSPEVVKARMQGARAKVVRGLLGIKL